MRAACVLAAVVFVGACSGTASPSEASPGVGSSSAPGSSSGSPGVTPPAESATADPSAGTFPSESPLTTGEAFQRIPATQGVLNSAWITEDRIVVAGFEGPNFKPVILVFRDGSWSRADVPDAVGQIAAIVGFRDGLIAVGNSLPDTRTGYVWASTDGASWRSVATVDGAAFYDVTTHGSTAVIGGAILDAEMTATAAAWSSADASAWAR